MRSLIVTLTLAMVCAGCSSTRTWRIRMKDGSELASSCMPEYHEKTGYYKYRCPSGKDALVREDAVARLERL
ncbi:MAG: YgdI/YgdR family lipoprotein [Verrucomicrobiaceae bacterium]|nr:YgdI/YgdR family lipoprotein [Verrucomicrobiaceae bacterium]